MPGRRALARAAAALAGALVVCGATAPAATAETPSPAAAVLEGLTLEQRVGQLFMVGTEADGIDPAVRSAVLDRHVGNVFLRGRSSAGVRATASVTRSLQSLVSGSSTGGVPLLVGTDQEGGAVQVLSGPGFEEIPSGLQQGSLSPSALQDDAARWGRQLRGAGVTLDLAPVMGTVPSPAAARSNPPIGVFDRQYGYTPSTVASHGKAFVRGMSSSGVATSVKHFPGLGRVSANTDTSTGVTDSTTRRDDAYVGPFAAAVADGAPFVMVSSAYYSRIDPRRIGAFSPVVVTGMIRSDLGFRGVVVSDSFSATQLSPFPLAERGQRLLEAGGDMVLVTQPGQLAAMYDGVLRRARRDEGFRASVDASAARVLVAKQDLGLVPVSPVGNRYFLTDALGGPVTAAYGLGRAGDQLAVGAWTGGRDTPAVRRGSRLYLPDAPGGRPSTTSDLGRPGDEVLAGDWDGDGVDSPGVRRGNVVYLVNDPGGPVVRSEGLGRPGDGLVVGDWDGDGRDSVGLVRGSTFLLTGSPVARSQVGRPDDLALAGDWDGDGDDEIAVRRGSTFFLTDDVGGPATRRTSLGRSGDEPFAGDFDGDGRDTLGVRR